MTRTLLLALLAAVPAAAAPIPEAEAERLAVARAYGTWTDPIGGCTFRSTGGRVWVRLPEFPRSAIEYLPGPVQAPRFVHQLDGDFTASVRVEVPHVPDGRLGTTAQGESRFAAAGLTAEDRNGNRAGIRKYEKMDGGHRTAYGSAWRKAANGGGGGSGTGGQKGGDTRLYVRLSRVGATAVFATSTDGATWREYGRQDLGWDGQVTLGLVAENSTGVPVEVAFDHFKLDVAKK